jgi:hypothetical protein
LRVLCVVKYRSLWRADHSSRGVLPNVVCLSAIVKPRQWESPGPFGRGGRLSRRGEKKVWLESTSTFVNAVLFRNTADNNMQPARITAKESTTKQVLYREHCKRINLWLKWFNLRVLYLTKLSVPHITKQQIIEWDADNKLGRIGGGGSRGLFSGTSPALLRTDREKPRNTSEWLVWTAIWTSDLRHTTMSGSSSGRMYLARDTM